MVEQIDESDLQGPALALLDTKMHGMRCARHELLHYKLCSIIEMLRFFLLSDRV